MRTALIQLCGTVDAPAQAQNHDLHIVNGNGLHRDQPWLGTVPDLRERSVQLPVQSLSRGRDVVASHRRRRRLDHKADRIHEHMGALELCQDLVGAVGVGPGRDLSRLATSHVDRENHTLSSCIPCTALVLGC
jgi:hypothetical protein